MLNFHYPLRAFQFLFAIIVLGLSAYLVHEDNIVTSHNSRHTSSFSFLIFTSLWTILALLFLLPASLAKLPPGPLSHPFLLLSIEALTAIFWFAGWIAVAALLGRAITCYGNVCSVAKADVVFAAFEWALFMATLAIATLTAFRGGGFRKGQPNAVQPMA